MQQFIKQAGSFGPFSQSSPCLAMTQGMKQFLGKYRFSKTTIIYENGYGALYYSLSETKKIGKYYLDLLAKDPSHIKQIFHDWLKKVEIMRKLGEKMNSDQELEQYFQLFQELWATGLVAEVYDENMEEILLTRAEENGVGLTESEKVQILHPDYLSWILKYERDLTAAIKNKTDLAQIKKEYYWINVDYLRASEVDWDVRIAEIKRRGLDFEMIQIQNKIDEIKQNYEQKQILYKQKIKATNLADLVDFFTMLVQWRDERKRMHQIGVYHLWRYIMPKIKISIDWQPYVVVQDYFNRQFAKKNYLEILQQRKKRTLLVIDDQGSFSWIFDQKEINKQVEWFEQDQRVYEDFRGNIGNKGKAIGQVRIINSSKDFIKMKPGDIIVASMTRPEYLSIMKQCSGIITDEGGITCHAAIVSRELGIPCIIGTKVGTRVLRDGMRVELNANHGLVKILK